MKKVLCAMSGGVDSSVAAALLVEAGYDVVGVTMKLWRGEDDPFAAHRYGGCCTIGATEDARRIADRLDIPYYVMNLQDEFDAAVVENFVEEYAKGRTPNPCARCNEFIKFAAFIDRAEELGCDYIATGHYAQVVENEGRFTLQRGVDRRKDQSYVLGMLTQRELSRTLLPIGHMEKDETRRIATELGMCVAAKPDSQEICFVEDGDYAKFVTTRAPQMAIAGEIVDTSGAHVGTHNGLAHYTVGQRKGLGIAAPAPLYVTKIDVENNALVVGTRNALGVDALSATNAKWAFAPVEAGMRAGAQLRAHGDAAPVTVTHADEHGFAITFDNPYDGVSPGQMCVLYDGDAVLGAGTIQ
ncbi:MAG TPA: tRNA 2-thiouridine(34) synthase MnmA [Abditibacteriaceae bacterium]|jgi:tRNA-specific 2-thiouridylase